MLLGHVSRFHQSRERGDIWWIIEGKYYRCLFKISRFCFSEIFFRRPLCAAEHGFFNISIHPLILVRQKRPCQEKFLSLCPGWKNIGLSPCWENITDIFSQRLVDCSSDLRHFFSNAHKLLVSIFNSGNRSVSIIPTLLFVVSCCHEYCITCINCEK